MGGDAHAKAASSSSSSYPKLSAGPVGQQITSIYRDRLGQFTGGGQYEGHNLLAALYEGRSSGDDVKLSVYSPPDHARPAFKDATKQEFKPTKVGEWFGPSWSTHWFKVHITVPERLRGQDKHLEFHWDANNEGLVWSEDGEPLQGLTGGGDRTEWILPEAFLDGKEHVFYVEMACNGMFGNASGDLIQPPQTDKYFQLNKAEIAAVNLDARALFYDFWIIGGTAVSPKHCMGSNNFRCRAGIPRRILGIP